MLVQFSSVQLRRSVRALTQCMQARHLRTSLTQLTQLTQRKQVCIERYERKKSK